MSNVDPNESAAQNAITTMLSSRPITATALIGTLSAIVVYVFASITNMSAGNITTGTIGVQRLPIAKSYTAFGDSITAGYAASVPANDYVNLIGAYLGLTPTNNGVSGDQVADQLPLIYQTAVQPNAYQLFTYMIGTNDSTFNGNDAGRVANFQADHQAELAFLAMPNKTLAQGNVVYNGASWNHAPQYGGNVAMQSTVANETATFYFYGTTLYLAYGAENGNAGTFTVSIDGVQYGGTYAATGFPTGGAATSISSQFGVTHSSFLLRIPGLSPGQHNVVFKNTTTGTGTVWLDWLGTPSGNDTVGGPQVIVGGLPVYNGPEGLKPFYRPLIQQDVAILQNDGLQVAYADVPAYQNPTTDLIADNTHPNDLGETHIAAAFVGQISNFSVRRNRNPDLAFRYLPFFGAIQSTGSTVTNADGTTSIIVGVPSANPATVSNVGVGNGVYGTANGSISGGGSVNTNFNAILGGTNGSIGYGSQNAIVGGETNAAINFDNFIGGGRNNSASGTRSRLGGDSAIDRGRYEADCWGGGAIQSQGDAQACQTLLHATSNSTTAVRLTSDGAAAGAANCVNIPNGYGFSLKINLVGNDKTNGGNTFVWSLPLGLMARTNGGVTLALGTPGYVNTGSQLGSTAVSATADSANSCLNLTVTPQNGDVVSWVARVETVETH